MAITAELAKKCGALTDKAYPLRVPGNPAAGREYGTAKKVRDYFNKCVANGGNIDEQPSEPATRTQRPDNGSDSSDQAPLKRRTFPDGCHRRRDVTVRNRTLAKDFEATIDSARTFLYAASVMLLVRRIARAS
jgi:hypothetical protein